MENHYGAVDLTLFGDYTRGSFDKGGDVPRLPPLRYGVQLSYDKEDWSSSLRFTRAEPQNHAGANETNTNVYLLLNLSTHIVSRVLISLKCCYSPRAITS